MHCLPFFGYCDNHHLLPVWVLFEINATAHLPCAKYAPSVP